jgi:hypothetical protein
LKEKEEISEASKNVVKANEFSHSSLKRFLPVLRGP